MKRNIQLTEEQLKAFKLKVLEFYKLYVNLTNYFDNNIATTCEVLIQNLSFVSCENSHEKELEKVNNILDLLEQIKNYNTYYLTSLAYEEIDNILAGILYND